MKIFFALFLTTLLPSELFAWGKRGHDVICYIAECHLTPTTQKRVSEILNGRSMVYYANWLDSASRTPKYSHTLPWHYFNMELNEESTTAKRDKSGDVLYGLQHLDSLLTTDDLTPNEELDALRAYIHILGDLHQPMHLGRKEDKGGGDIPVVYFVESTSLHAVWDFHIVEGAHAWSYTEWQQQIDRLNKEAESEITKGNYCDWIDQTHEITRKIYRTTPAESRIFYEYLDSFTPLLEQQLLNAGLRLAHRLNMIYDREYLK